jgi:hypothetical protein
MDKCKVITLYDMPQVSHAFEVGTGGACSGRQLQGLVLVLAQMSTHIDLGTPFVEPPTS